MPIYIYTHVNYIESEIHVGAYQHVRFFFHVFYVFFCWFPDAKMVVALVLLTFASQIGEYYAGAFPYSFDFLYWEEVWQPATFSVGMVLVGP